MAWCSCLPIHVFLGTISKRFFVRHGCGVLEVAEERTRQMLFFSCALQTSRKDSNASLWRLFSFAFTLFIVINQNAVCSYLQAFPFIQRFRLLFCGVTFMQHDVWCWGKSWKNGRMHFQESRRFLWWILIIVFFFVSNFRSTFKSTAERNHSKVGIGGNVSCTPVLVLLTSITSNKCLVLNSNLAGGKCQAGKQNKPTQQNDSKLEMPPTPDFVSNLNAAAANAAGAYNVGGLGQQIAVHPLIMTFAATADSATKKIV